MARVNVQKRGKVYQYRFEVASIGGKRKYINKSGFKSKNEALEAGMKAYNNYLNTGKDFTPNTISYSDYLDYWMKQYCEINLKYHTIQAYSNIIKNHIKPGLGAYRLSQITASTLQEFVNTIFLEKSFSKNFMKNILKVLKSSFGYAADVVEFIKVNPAIKVKVPKYDVPDEDPAHIFTKEEINMIFSRFKSNHCVYYAFMTAYYTGMRVSEVFALTWDDIDLENKKITVNKNILKKNQAGGTKNRLIEGRATTTWYFGTCKTPSSYRTIDIGDTLANKQVWTATGRRKSAVAQVKLVGGTGKITINGRDVDEYMPYATLVMDLKQPLVATNNENRFDIEVKVNGGGFDGQTGAIRLAITRALLAFDANTDQTREDSYRHILKNAGFVTRDPRIKERKKYGLKKARRAPQFSKR